MSTYNISSLRTIKDTSVLDHAESVHNQNASGQKTRIGIAPHFMNFCGMAILTTDKFCSVTSSKIRNKRLQNENQHSVVFLNQHTNTTDAEQFIRIFMKNLDLRNIYKIQVMNPLNHSGQFSYATIAIALWKSLGKPCSETDLMNSLIRMSSKNERMRVIINSIIDGSQSYVRTVESGERHERGVPKSCMNPQIFENHSFVFVRSNLHEPGNEEMFGNANMLYDLLCLNGKPSESQPLENVMDKYTSTRMGQISTQHEQDCFDGLQQLQIHQFPFGFQIRKNGVLIALRKNHGSMYQRLEAIAKQIAVANTSLTPVHHVTFHLIKPSSGAAVITQKEAHQMKEEYSVEMSLERIANLPPRGLEYFNDEHTDTDTDCIEDETFD